MGKKKSPAASLNEAVGIAQRLIEQIGERVLQSTGGDEESIGMNEVKQLESLTKLLMSFQEHKERLKKKADEGVSKMTDEELAEAAKRLASVSGRGKTK